LKKAATEPEIKYRLDGKTLSIDDYLNRQRATGLIVLKDGEILIERYQYGRKSDQRLVSHSMAKTVVLVMVHTAVAKTPTDPGMWIELDELWRGVVAYYGRW
jgi:hypothetical protein